MSCTETSEMTERCNILRSITAALCCFYQKSSVIGAKVSKSSAVCFEFTKAVGSHLIH